MQYCTHKKLTSSYDTHLYFTPSALVESRKFQYIPIFVLTGTRLSVEVTVKGDRPSCA